MASQAPAKKKSSWQALGLALTNRKTGFMLVFGFASGLPFALFLGTLFAWLTETTLYRANLITERQRQAFLAAPLRNTILAILRSATNSYPNVGPLARQPGVLGRRAVGQHLAHAHRLLLEVQVDRVDEVVQEHDRGHAREHLMAALAILDRIEAHRFVELAQAKLGQLAARQTASESRPSR